jgi:hypothetical protein
MPPEDENFDDILDNDADIILKDTLQKAEKKNKEEPEDDYDDKYMRKYLKKFMKKNPDYMKNMIGRKAMGSERRAMKKATSFLDPVDEFNDSFEEIAPEIDGNAQVVSVDGTRFIKAFGNLAYSLLDAFEDVSEKLDNIEEKAERTDKLQKAIGAVQLKISEAIDKFGKTPKPRQGQGVNDVATSLALQKAQSTQAFGQNFLGAPAGPMPDEQHAMLLQKAMAIPHGTLTKALTDTAIKNNAIINEDAARVLSNLEAGGSVMRLNKADLQFLDYNIIRPRFGDITQGNQEGGVQ